MKWARRILIALLLLAAAAHPAWRWWRSKNLGAVQRGYVVAESKGCFACHGPGGRGLLGQGMPNPGHEFGDVPVWSAEVSSPNASSEAEIREWILDGTSARVRGDPELAKIRAGALVPMPAFRGRLTDRELDDVVAYVKAVVELDRPTGARAVRGREAAAKYGCFGCHGPQGRGAAANVGSFEGYIPSWDGADFAAIAENDDEIREWILDGASQRIARHPVAGRFIRSQLTPMPKYRGVVSADEVEDLIAYIHWVRSNPY